MKYQYKSVSFSSILQVQKDHGEVAAKYDSIINNEAEKGWELYLIDTVTSFKPGGCAKGKDEQFTIKVAVFRRLVE